MNLSFKDQNQDHKNFTVLQNILSHLGLTAFERSVYWAVKECAWENSSCTKSYAKLAQISGMSEKSLKRSLKSLCEINKILKKPLISIKHRITESGDQDTNQIIVNELWTDNYIFFKEKIGGVTQTPPPVTQTPPGVVQSPGVGSHRPDRGSHRPTNKTSSKTPIKKTSSSSVSSKSSDDDDDEILKNNFSFRKEDLQALKDWIDKESTKKRIKKVRGGQDEFTWGRKWIIFYVDYEKLAKKYGIIYLKEQFEFMVKYQEDFDIGDGTIPVKKPLTFIKLACKNNYNNSSLG